MKPDIMERTPTTSLAREGRNISITLSARAALYPLSHAVIYPHTRDHYGRVSYTHLTYAKLDADSTRVALALQRYGVHAGQRTVLMLPPGLDFFTLTFALFKLGAIPVLIDPGMGVKNLKQCLEQVEPQVFIGNLKANLARQILGWCKGSLQHCVTTSRVGVPRTARLQELLFHAPSMFNFTPFVPATNSLAAILFTSGSTGPAKGTEYTHENFYAQIEALKELYAIEPGEIDMCTFPLFALFAPALGMTAVIPDMDASKPGQVNPERIFEAFDNFHISNMFGSPALLRRVATYGCRQGRKLPSLKRVISAGAPVPASILRQMESMLRPECQVYTPYGATEALPVCSIGNHEILTYTAAKTDMGAGICVGTPVAGVDVRIIRICDAAIDSWDDVELMPAGEGGVGEICVRGPQVTAAYYRREHATKNAKIYSGNSDFYHRMGDVGYMDELGRVWFCGRKNHRVETAEATLFTIPCEAVFNLHPQVARTALVGCGDRGTQRAVLCVELNPDVSVHQHSIVIADLKAIQHQYPHTAEISAFLIHPDFPVDVRHNAKIFREHLALWAQERLK
ncbi:MAG: fatty acid CoA ligase family protein [Desulfuromonadaceae bacterium]